MHLCQECGWDPVKDHLIPKSRLSRGTGLFSRNENRKVYSAILTGEQVTCQLQHMGQVLFSLTLIYLPTRCRSIPSFLPSGVCGRSQEILPRHSLVDSQPCSGAATCRTEAVIPVRGWTGLLLPPHLFSLPHLPLLYPASSDEEEWGQHLKRLESSPECPKRLSARESCSYKGLR